MRISNSLMVFSQIINFIVFIYFSIVLIKINALDITGLFISALSILISLIVNIIAVIEE